MPGLKPVQWFLEKMARIEKKGGEKDGKVPFYLNWKVLL